MEEKRERPPGYRHMTKEEFVERMLRDAERRQTGDMESADERRERAEREEQQKRKKEQQELGAYRATNIAAYAHTKHLRDRKARIRGSL